MKNATILLCIPLLLCALLALPQTTIAQGTITDGAASASFGAGFTGTFAMQDLEGDGVTDHLFELFWFYSVAGDTDPTPLGAPDVEDYTGNVATLTWNDVDGRGLFSAVWRATLSEVAPNQAEVTHVMTLTSLGPSSDVTLWLYSDQDVNGTAGTDTAVLDTPNEQMTVTDVQFLVFSMPGASAYSIKAFGDDLDGGIDDGTAVPLDNTGSPFGPGDFTGAYETTPGTVSLALAPVTVIAQQGVNVVPVPLPVELTAFDVLMDDAAALLNWTTASETNNAGFEIQHAVEEGQFQTVGFVEGAGTTNEAQAYTYRVAGLDYGHHQFRLKQVDFDGTFEYSGVIETDRVLPEGYVLGAFYPNPFNPQGRFTLRVANDQDVQVGLYNVMGQQVDVLHSGQLSGQEQHTFTVTADALPSGPYFIRIVGEHFVGQQQITLLK